MGPVLLLGKPVYIYFQHASQSASASQPISTQIEIDQDSTSSEDPKSKEVHSFSEVLIHQCIETIEFVLGMVSNTASYLRLWALSLAHSELATVFWDKAMLSTLNMNWFATFIGFGIFAGVTFGVLLMMDVLECFLHALRLHWVEFQNKFYKADGIRFNPYSIKQTIKDSQ